MYKYVNLLDIMRHNRAWNFKEIKDYGTDNYGGVAISLRKLCEKSLGFLNPPIGCWMRVGLLVEWHLKQAEKCLEMNFTMVRLRQVLNSYQPSYPPKSRVIDVGCGTGRWSRVVSEFDCEVLGIDYSAKDISTARTLGGNVKYLEFDATKKIKDLGRFDFALLIHVLEHIDNPELLLREVRINCSKLIIEVPDYESNALNWTRRKLSRSYYSDADHVREYSLDLITKQLEATSWKATFTVQKGGSILIVAV